MATEVASLFATISLNDKLTSGLNNAKGGLDSFASSLTSVGTKMSAVGAAGQQAMAPFANALKDSVFAAMGFDEAMTNANSILQLSSEEIGKISDEILAMGTNSIAGPQAVANAYYDIVSGVADASTHIDILNTSIAVSEAGAADLTATNAALIAVMNSYGFAAKDAAFAGDVLVRTVGMGVDTMDGFAAAFPQVTGLASTLGVSFDDLGAQMAYITTKGFSASEAATQIKASMTALINPNETMIKAFKELGVANGEALIQMYGLDGALAMVADSSVVAKEGLAKTLGSVEALNGTLALTGDGAQAFFDAFSGGSIELHNALENVEVMQNVIKSSMALGQSDLWGNKANLASVNALAEEMKYLAEGTESYTESARKVQKASPAAQFKLMKSQVAGLAIEIGTALLPALMDIMRAMQPVLTGILSWTKENPALVSGIAMVVAGLTGLFAVMLPMGIAISAVGTVLGLVLSPIGLVVVALGLLAAAYATNFLGIQDFLKPAVEWLIGAFQSVIGWIGDLVGAFKEGGLAGVATMIGEQIAELATSIMNTDWGAVWANIKTKAGELWENFKTGAAIASGFILSNVVMPLAMQLGAVDWSIVWEQIKTMAGKLWDNFKTGMLLLGTFVLDNLVTPLANLIATTDWNLVLEAMKTAALAMLNAYKDAMIFEVNFILDNVVTPLSNLIKNTDWQSVYDSMAAIGDKIISALGDAISAGASIIETAVKGAINAAIPDHVGFSIGAVEVAGRTVVPATNVGIDIPNPFPGYAKGTSWTGDMGTNTPAGIAHGKEAVIPSGGMTARIMPSPNGLMAQMNGRGGGVSVGVVNVYGVQNARELYEELRKIEAQSGGSVQTI